MKFSALKALPVPGKLTDDWKRVTLQQFAKDPEIVRKDYVRLVESIADLELIEDYLREEVLHIDEPTNVLRKTVDLARELGVLIAPILTAYSPGSAKEVIKALGIISGIRSLDELRKQARTF